MKAAFTMDDLPLWPMSNPPEGYTAAGIVDAITSALHNHGINGVYAFSNSWALEKHPDMAAILDDWVAAGHHIANHTHNHWHLPNVEAAAFISDIRRADALLAKWIAKAPRRLFRHPLCHWGDTPEKLALVNAALIEDALTPVDVTSWSYEWVWNRAYRNADEAGDQEALTFIRESFLDFSIAQFRHDQAAAKDWFGHEIIGITLGHNVPFFADIADAYFARWIAEGVEFVPLEDALTSPVQDTVGSVVSDKFLVLQQKLADAVGHPTSQIAPDQVETHARIVKMAEGQTG